MLAGIVLMITACNNDKNQITAKISTSLFPKGDQVPEENFTSNAFSYPLLPRDENNEYSLGSVTFEPGARTKWHMYPKGQV